MHCPMTYVKNSRHLFEYLSVYSIAQLIPTWKP